MKVAFKVDTQNAQWSEKFQLYMNALYGVVWNIASAGIPFNVDRRYLFMVSNPRGKLVLLWGTEVDYKNSDDPEIIVSEFMMSQKQLMRPGFTFAVRNTNREFEDWLNENVGQQGTDWEQLEDHFASTFWVRDKDKAAMVRLVFHDSLIGIIEVYQDLTYRLLGT